MDKIPNINLPKLAACSPAMMKVAPGKVYSWCTCGLSQKQPLCDGAHKCIEPTINELGEAVLPYRSLKMEFDKEEEVWFCQCKQTKTPPFCDGSHKLHTGDEAL